MSDNGRESDKTETTESWRDKIDKNEVGENETTSDKTPPQPEDDDD